MTAYTMQNAHHEIALEQHLTDQLIAKHGYISRKAEDYDRTLAVDRELVLQFVKDTQPGEWRKLEAQYTTAAEAEFFAKQAASASQMVRFESEFLATDENLAALTALYRHLDRPGS